MSILHEIQEAAVDGGSDLGTLLRKCKILAARLGSQPLESWLVWESNGYPEDVKVPDYRVWPLQIKGTFLGPGGSGLRNAPIPLTLTPEKIRSRYRNYECRQSVASIETVLKEHGLKNVYLSTGDLAVALGGEVYEGLNCVQARAEFGATQLVELLNAVRNRILDFSLAISKEAPYAGEVGHQSDLQPSKITQMFQTIIYGGSANIVGTAQNSSITFNVRIDDFESLREALKQHGIANEDLEDLRQAISVDPRPTHKDKLGPKVSAWVAKMLQRAAERTWDIGITAGATVLIEAIAKFYGL